MNGSIIEEIDLTDSQDTAVYNELEGFARAILSGQATSEDGGRPEQALADLELIDAILKSGSSDGQPQTLQYQNF